MIVYNIANVVLALLNTLFVFNLPQIPDSVIALWNQIWAIFGDGLDMLHVLIGDIAFAVVGVLLQLIIFANVTYFTVSLVFFVLKKIPLLGIRE